MRRFIPLLFLVMLALPGPAWARMVAIEASAPLTDHSEASMERALRGAVELCVQHASSLGLLRVKFERAVLLRDRLIVMMLATDEDTEDAESVPQPDNPGELKI